MSVAPVIVTASSRVAVVGTWLAARRREWCRVLLDFPPDQAGHDPMIATRTAVLDGGYTNITDWIDLAHRAEAVGAPADLADFRLDLGRDCLALECPNHRAPAEAARPTHKAGTSVISVTD